MNGESGIDAAKCEWRARLGERRRSRSAGEIAAARQAIATHLLPLLGALAPGGAPVGAYLPLGTEPMPTQIVNLLRDNGYRPWLPITRPGLPLGWAEPGDALRTAALGVQEPVAEPIELAATEVTVILVPAVAVDQQGYRMGRGGGYYDRTLAGSPATTIAVIFDDEWVDHLPHEAHDVPVGGVLTPSGVRWIGRAG